MSWTADGTAVGGTDRLVMFCEMGGDIYAMGYDADGASGWHKRTAPATWTQCTQVAPAFVGEGQGDYWNSLIWDTDSNDKVWRSANGVAWTMDKDFAADYGTEIFVRGRIGGQGTSYLVVAHWDAGASVMRFARRSTGGIWTNNIATAYPGLVNPLVSAILRHHSGYIWWSGYDGSFGSVTREWDGAAWSTAPDIGFSTVYHFLYHGGLLFAATNDGVFRWRGPAYGWIKETDVAPGYAISVGSDSELYFATGTAAKIYKRLPGGTWIRVSTYGATSGGIGTEHGGTLFLGNSTRDFYVYALDWDAAVSAGLYPQAMDVGGDGNQLYIGLIDTATTFPVLVAVGLPLAIDATGSRVFIAVAGAAINVKTTNIGDKLAIAGNFGVNEQVEVSEDGGATWVDIDRDAWGAETAQPVLVDPDTVDEVMVALQTAQAITETDDGGATAWTVNNAAVGYGIQAMARLPDGDELVIGDAHAARKVEYSPNRGVTLADITGGVAIGDVVALEVA